jgi:aminopeptidase-like protein
MMHDLLKSLFPICRSLTGNGVRETVRILQEHVPLNVYEFPTGTECFDWTIPNEWNIKSATLKDESGRTMVDFADNNLHVLGYSEPVSGVFTLDELMPHLYSLPHQPDTIPYLTSYYKRNWGFCMQHRKVASLKPGKYQVNIDSTLRPGSLTVADVLVPGETKKEIFFSCYYCHPSMANDSLSGVVMAVALYDYVSKRKNNRYSYRFIFVPETIGAIAYLSRNGAYMKENAYAGMILTCLGDAGDFTYKKTRQENHPLDLISEHVLKCSGKKFNILKFIPDGSDERQYSSPGFNMPTGTLMRSVYGEFPEYHTSGDNLEFVTEKSLLETRDILIEIINSIEGNFHYQNLKPFCEPFLSKYGMYNFIGGKQVMEKRLTAMLNILNYSDGQHSILDIARRLEMPIPFVSGIANELAEKGLMKKLDNPK